MKKTVLVIDDHAVLRRVMSRALRGHFDVTACDTVATALAHCDGPQTFDAILCDMCLDDGTGQDFYERLRARSVDQSDRILFLSGQEGPRSEAAFNQATREAPFYQATRGRHLLKPIATDLLIANLAMMAGPPAAPSP